MTVKIGHVSMHHSSFPGDVCAASSTSKLTPSVPAWPIQRSINHQDTNPCPLTPDRRHSCSVCFKDFPTSRRLDNSLCSHTGERRFLCSYAGCGMSFSRRDTARVHESRIHGPRQHTCSECPRSFALKNELNRHVLSHKGERHFLCSYAGCDMSFSRPDTARAHERRIYEPRQYACSECPSSFVLETELHDHYRSHTGERPFQCSYAGCGMSFPRRDTARVHERRIHGPRQHTCSECPRSFALKNELNRHVLSHTSKQSF